MRENVYWPHQKVQTSQGEMEVAVFSWDGGSEEGTALVPGGYVTSVRCVGGELTVSLEEDEDYDPFKVLQ